MSIMTNVNVYGLFPSIRASKLPMSVDPDSLTDEITNGVKTRALAAKGTGHDQFLTGIIVQADFRLSIKAWVEMERYHFVDFVSSQSTMHRITKMDIDKQTNEYVDPRIIQIVQGLVEAYNDEPTPRNYLHVLYNVPTGLELTARLTTNYRQLKTIYSQRKEHRLPEWRCLCEELKQLPESWMIVGEEDENHVAE